MLVVPMSGCQFLCKSLFGWAVVSHDKLYSGKIGTTSNVIPNLSLGLTFMLVGSIIRAFYAR